jgi:uroporphyrinogen-III synthase
MTTEAGLLHGYGIAVTRPSAQAGGLADLIAAQGGKPVLFPLLAIVPLADYSAFERKLAVLENVDWAIFISSNAVQQALPRLLERLGAVPGHLRCAAVGPTTAAALARFGIDNVLVPTSGFDSEALLALPELQQVAGQRFMIFRGVGGREKLAETLKVCGAVIDHAECYRRVNPQRDAGVLHALWQNKALHAIVVTSSEAMRHLLQLTDDGKATWLRDVTLCVSHARIAELPRQLGLRVAVAEKPTDDAVLQCLTQALAHAI